MKVRLATVADAAVIARHRVGMLAAMAPLAEADARRVAAGTERFLAETMPMGEWVSWIAEEDGAALGSGSAILRRLAPRPGNPDGGTEAYLLNFFTEPHARRRGVADAVMRACLAWCRERGVARVTLHATAMGRRVYERAGFVPRDNDMEWKPPVA